MQSIITDVTEYCIICGKPKWETHHLVFGYGGRQLSDEDGLTIPVCRECHELIHSDGRIGILSKMLGQIAWEKKNGDREKFRKRYGKSYL